ncbi:MAG: MATE family efflux transporter [Bacteroidales bacterium]|nr:MATE family efflux transporter [Bacteroidales bacterium]
MRIQISDHFTYGRLLRFVLPTVTMMIFTSIYSMVDGLFVSNFVGKVSFAAVNLVMPVLAILGAFGFMVGSGGTAIVGITLGEGKRTLANERFSMLLVAMALTGTLLAALSFVLIRPLAALFGASGELLSDAVRYGRIIMLGLPFFMIQNAMESFFIAAEKPRLGLWMTLLSGGLNILFDALFIVVFKWGLAGAAVATAFSQAAGSASALLYFASANDSLLHLAHPRFDATVFWRACANGSSEMVSSIAFSFIAVLYNYQLMRYAGSDGVAACGVVMYAGFIFSAIFYGYATGCAPIVSFHYGAGDRDELKNIFRKSLCVVSVSGAAMLLLVQVLARPIADAFIGYDAGVYLMTVKAFRIFSISLIFSGFSAYASSFFTALGNGTVSAFISFLRTLLFETASVMILPGLFGLDGIWWSFVTAEIAAVVLSFFFLWRNRKTYGYL